MVDVRNNLLGITDAVALERAEGETARYRIAELQERPILGAFDVAHLRAINHHIFQDVYPDAGALRSELGLWAKGRSLENARYGVYYKPADEMQVELPKILAQANQENWAQHTTPKQLAGPLAKLYGDLDYQHPFVDGNSRTLREFIRQLIAEKTLQYLSWAHTANPRKFREILYRARDAEVLQRALNDALIAREPDLRASVRLIREVNASRNTLHTIIERGLVLGRSIAMPNQHDGG